MDLNSIRKKLALFAKARNWDQYHTPKNLSMALACEAAEMLEIFQWLTEDESKKENMDKKTLAHAEEEIADILNYLIRLADKLDIDLEKAVNKKIKLNAKKYPVHLAKNNAVKYNRRQK
ncbi:MAG: nucleotide pyrophosphohydrolase [Ignavibacteriae bacterium]|nr:MAG: nucleotide pyrophosphohydrolase [Ignavibacteriota bacterium]